MRLGLIFMILINLLLSASSPSLCKEDLGGIDYDSYKGKTLTLRTTYTTNRRIYVYLDGREFSYIHGESLLFPVLKSEEVVVTRIDPRDYYIRVEFESDHLGIGMIDFLGPRSLLFKKKFFTQMMNKAFEGSDVSTPGAQSIPIYLGHKGSKIVHLDGCNHVPSKEYLEMFSDLSVAEELGYSRCPICFTIIPQVPEYALEKRLSQELAANIRSLYPPALNLVSQERVARVGRTVLSNWPQPLRRYSYSFQLVEGEEPNAFACPAGKIFITTYLLESLDSDEELESVLAHEIAHVERRHGYREYSEARTMSKWGVVAAVVAGSVVASQGGNYQQTSLAMDVADLISNLASSIALSGYSRDHEEEADSYALYYFTSSDRLSGRNSYLNVLRKLKYYEDSQGIFNSGEGLFSTHPGIDRRIAIARHSRIGVFTEPQRFAGLDLQGDEVAVVTFQMQRFHRLGEKRRGSRSPFKQPGSDDGTRLTLFATVAATSLLGEKAEIKDIKIETHNKKLKMDNREDTVVLPNCKVGIRFEKRGNVSLLDGEIEKLKLSLPNVSEWVKVDVGGRDK